MVLHLLDDKSRARKKNAGVIKGKEAAIICGKHKHQWHAKSGWAQHVLGTDRPIMASGAGSGSDFVRVFDSSIVYLSAW